MYQTWYISAIYASKLRIRGFGRNALSVRRLAIEPLPKAPLPWVLRGMLHRVLPRALQGMLHRVLPRALQGMLYRALRRVLPWALQGALYRVLQGALGWALGSVLELPAGTPRSSAFTPLASASGRRPDPPYLPDLWPLGGRWGASEGAGEGGGPGLAPLLYNSSGQNNACRGWEVAIRSGVQGTATGLVPREGAQEAQARGAVSRAPIPLLEFRACLPDHQAGACALSLSYSVSISFLASL
jgi:hypothetical protein